MRLGILLSLASAVVESPVRPQHVWVPTLDVCPTREAALAPESAAGVCTTRAINDIDPQQTEVWARARVVLPAGTARLTTPVAVIVIAMASSEVFWDGERVGANGTPAGSAASEEPGLLEVSFHLRPDQLSGTEHVLALHLSSWHTPVRVSTPVHAIIVGADVDLLLARFVAYLPALITAGALLLTIGYFLVAFLRDRSNRDALLIGGMGLFALTQLSFELWRVVTPLTYPQQVWRLIGVVVCASGFGLFMVVYVTRRFTSAAAAKALVMTSVGALATVLLTRPPPSWWYHGLGGVFRGFDGLTFLLLAYSALVALVISARALWRGRRDAKWITMALGLYVGLMLVEREAFMDRGFFVGVGLLSMVLLLDQLALLSRVREAERVATTRAALLELELLKRRMAPHWLMNTLNAIVSWIETEPKTAVRMVEALADEFRLVSQLGERESVTLAEELALCQRHLEVMSLRVDRPFALECEGVTPDLLVPPGVLHTLVENAFTHGRYRRGAIFRLSQQMESGRILLRFSAPAPEERPETPRAIGGGDGLAYVQRRMHAVFGVEAQVQQGPHDGGWLTILTFAPVRS